MRRRVEGATAGRLVRYVAMTGLPPVRAIRAVVAMVAAAKELLAAVTQLPLGVVMRERLAAERCAASRDLFAVRIN
jgi:hypothetical protein